MMKSETCLISMCRNTCSFRKTRNCRHSSFSGRGKPRHADNSDFRLGEIIRKGLEPFTRHPFIVPEQWKEFMKQEETEQASSASVKFKELRSRNTSEHNMGPAGIL
jgi:hypothetical protein